MPARKRPGRRTRRRHRGFTLVELAMVFGIIGLLALGALAAYNVVVAQHQSAKAIADVTAVRAAVLKWAGGGPLAYPRISSISSGGGTNYATNPLTLQKWDSLAPHLPAHLKTLADGDADLVLTGANPWNGRYEIVPPVPANPMRWELALGQVPCALTDELEHQLRKTSLTTVLQTGGCPGAVRMSIQYDE